MSSSIESTATAVAAATSTAASAAASQPASFKLIGVLLAVGSGLFIGSSFVFKKKGLLSAQQKSGTAAGDGHAYLKSPMWWTGMTLMIVGEILNFVAYAFTEAILVTPLGALSVVVCAVLSSIFLKETLTFFGKIGCALCIIGAVIIALNGPQEQTTSTIPEFQKLFLAPGFLVYASLVLLTSLGLILFVAPKYGKTHMLVYITICSLIGGLSVACTQGLGSSILTSIRGDNQFHHWFIYFLLAFVIFTLLTEINYLNKALELFNTAMVTPMYYVLFTGSTLITSVILYQGFKATAVDIVTVVMGFLVIVAGITLLQLSKVDPTEISQKLDRRSTILLSAARAEVHRDGDAEKDLEAEDPGMDALRGTFGAIGSIHRAMSARRSIRREGGFDPSDVLRRRSAANSISEHGDHPMIVRHQLYDNPMPFDATDKISAHSPALAAPRAPFTSDGMGRERSASIKFAPEDTLHLYSPKIAGPTTRQTQPRSDHAHTHHDPRSADIGSSFAASSSADTYADPYESHEGATSTYQTRSQTLPRLSSGSNLVTALSQHFASSSPDLPTNNPGPATTPTRSRFNLPHFPGTGNSSTASSSHRTPRPPGPADMDAQESMRLVRRDSDSEDEGMGNDSREMEL